MLAQGPQDPAGKDATTYLALGFVQSGKTTSITAIIAAGADEGYRVVIALMGATNLLLEQNRQRLEKALGIGERQDYVWVVESNPSGSAAAKRLDDWLRRDRVVLIPVLKHAGRIRAVASCLQRMQATNVPVLIVDDEADQASLNTMGASAESRTYEAIRGLRESVSRHLYVQYTATPYAPLLLEADDLLSPQHVEFLQPGPGYTGGREFFVDSADRVVRDVPSFDEQASKNPPLELPKSLVSAFSNYLVGAALLLTHEPAGAPVSMLVHSTARNDVQARYEFLLQRQLAAWRRSAEEAGSWDDLPSVIDQERAKLVESGALDVDNAKLLPSLRFALREATLWLINSASELNKVDWTKAPLHVLVGGNKLDRGFTVEGLTVTYMNRPTTVQVDTLEQRARAFGYRRDQPSQQVSRARDVDQDVSVERVHPRSRSARTSATSSFARSGCSAPADVPLLRAAAMSSCTRCARCCAGPALRARRRSGRTSTATGRPCRISVTSSPALTRTSSSGSVALHPRNGMSCPAKAWMRTRVAVEVRRRRRHHQTKPSSTSQNPSLVTMCVWPDPPGTRHQLVT